MPSNPILDAWLTAWTHGLSLTTQLTSAWLGGRSAGASPWAAWPIGGGTAGGNPWAALSTAGGNPWSSFGGVASGNPFASLAGMQSMMSLMMAPWGGGASRLATLPWPWGHWAQAGFGQGLGGWPGGNPWSTFGAGNGWPMSMGLGGVSGVSGFAGPDPTAAGAALPWPWNMLTPQRPNAGPAAWGLPPGFMGTPPTPKAADADPMGFGQVMQFWSAMIPGAATARTSHRRESVAEPAPAAADLSKLFPWMAWMK